MGTKYLRNNSTQTIYIELGLFINMIMKKRFFWLGPLLLSLLLFLLYVPTLRGELSTVIGRFLGVLFGIAISATAKYIVDVKLEGKYIRRLLIIIAVDVILVIFTNPYYPHKTNLLGTLVVWIPDFIVILYLLFKISSQIDKDKQ